jgi:hypothetical protein
VLVLVRVTPEEATPRGAGVPGEDEDVEEVGERTEKLATGELVEEEPELAVVVLLLKHRVE